MKAIIWTNYGPPDVLQLREVERPVPKDGEVLVRICGTTVTAGDCEMRSLRLPLLFSLPMRLYIGVIRPTRIRILGQELAGDIEAAGEGVTRFKEGDQVFGTTGLHLGAYAEYVCLPAALGAGALAVKPGNLTYEQAAAVPLGGLEALHFLRKAKIQPGEKVLIFGAGGSIGTMAIQLARHYGAEVTGVDRAGKLEMLRSIGAGQVIDSDREDFTRSSEMYDVIFDVVGKSPYSPSLQALKDGGRYLLVNPSPSQMVLGSRTSKRSSKEVILGAASHTGADLAILKELIEMGEIKPVIDRTYPLEQAAEAHRYVESGQKLGNVILKVGCEEKIAGQLKGVNDGTAFPGPK